MRRQRRPERPNQAIWLVRTANSCIEWARPEAWPRWRTSSAPPQRCRVPGDVSYRVLPAGWDLEGAGRPAPERTRSLGLQISGVGWRADWVPGATPARLRLTVGWVAEPEVRVPEDLEVTLEEKGRLVRVRGASYKVSAWAAGVINKRPWNPFTGHGIFPDGWVGPRRSGKGR